jgi:AAA+ ATPase superfamily predicted ATPase
VELTFANRTAELAELDEHARNGGLLVLFGRRRVGKTGLLTRWLTQHGGLYSQAIEASKDQQLDQVVADLRPHLSTALSPRSWADLFELLDLQPRDFVLCLDEFPYLVAADPSLPSVLQRWLDHRKRKKSALVLAGSSTRMMNDLFLNRGAPLYGPARKVLEIAPMGYAAFCKACRQNPASADSFARFALVGGVPKYWELVERGQSPVALAQALYFGVSPFLEVEPTRLLRDEQIAGFNAPSVLEAIGRGAEKPSEIAARLNTPQTNLSRLFQVLVDARLVVRQVPWGESLRTTKRSLYRLEDPMLRFWFRVYSPHRSRWAGYSEAEKAKLVDDHAATVFEDVVRARWPGAARYWEAGAELDSVREEDGRLVVSEVKWAALSKAERDGELASLKLRFARTALARKHTEVSFEVKDRSELAALARRG